MESSALTVSQLAEVKRGLAEIEQHVPAWKPLLSGPVIFMHLDTKGLYSLTNPVIPQCVFLGDEAFASLERLPETLVHELAHIWLGLINEIAPLVRLDDAELFTLPSGTSGKTALGVIFAAHFAAAAIVYYEASPTTKGTERLVYLRDYLSGCLQLLHRASGMTAEGCRVVESFHAFNDRRGQNC